jgi:hypothetical protein
MDKIALPRLASVPAIMPAAPKPAAPHRLLPASPTDRKSRGVRGMAPPRVTASRASRRIYRAQHRIKANLNAARRRLFAQDQTTGQFCRRPK